MTHTNNHPNRRKRDRRYTIAREYCGYDTPRWVARFCGEWIGQAKRAAGAQDLIAAHMLERAVDKYTLARANCAGDLGDIAP